MPLTQQQIAGFRLKAKQAGYSDQQIADEIKRKRQAEESAPTAKMDVKKPEFSKDQTQPQEKGLLSKIGEGAIGVGKSLLQPFKGLAADTYDLGKFAFAGGEKAFGPQYQNPFRSEQDLQKTRNQQDLGGFALDQAKNTAGILSYGVPFGKAGFIGSKAIVPGAIVGAAQEFAQPESTPESVAGAAITGGVTGGVLQGAGAVINKVKGTGGFLNKQASALEEGTRKIRVKPSVSGAQQEKAINSTLDRLGFKGSAQTQYENLQPAMDKLETEIQTEIKNNPDVTVKTKDIITSFMDKLKSSVRTKDLTSTQAKKEVNGYLKDIMKEAGKKGKVTEIGLQELRTLKALINKDYGRINAKLESNSPLNPTEKVIAEGWSALDDAVKTASPEIKKLLLDESNLYKAAAPLSAARVNPPTMRIAGTSVPAQVTQALRDVATGTLRKTAGATEAISDVIPTVPTSGQGVINQVLPRVPSLIKEAENNGQNNQDNQITTDNFNQNINSLSSPIDSTSGGEIQTTPAAPPTITGHSVAEHLQALSTATAKGDKNAVAAIKAQLAIEQEYQKSAASTGTQQEAILQNAKANVQKMKELYGLGTNETLSQGKSTVGIAGAFARSGREVQKQTNQDFVDRLGAYNNMRSFAAGLLNQARGAGVLNAGEYEVMTENMPNEYVSEKQARSWFENMDDILKRMNAKGVTSSDQLQAQLGGFASQ